MKPPCIEVFAQAGGGAPASYEEKAVPWRNGLFHFHSAKRWLWHVGFDLNRYRAAYGDLRRLRPSNQTVPLPSLQINWTTILRELVVHSRGEQVRTSGGSREGGAGSWLEVAIAEYFRKLQSVAETIMGQCMPSSLPSHGGTGCQSSYVWAHALCVVGGKWCVPGCVVLS
jgi:hypothetical protein